MRKIDGKIMAQAVKEYNETNCSLRDLSKKYGFAYETIRKYLGTSVRPRGVGKMNKSNKPVISSQAPIGQRKLIKLPTEQRYNSNRAWDGQEDEMLKYALKEGYTVKELSELLGRSITSIYSRKCILTGNKFLSKGSRFRAPKGLLRKKHTRVTPDISPEVAETNRLLKKYGAINNPAKEKTAPVREKTSPIINGINPVQETKHVRVVKFDDQADIHAIRLEDLASIVNKHGVSVSISILKTGTEITIKK